MSITSIQLWSAPEAAVSPVQYAEFFLDEAKLDHPYILEDATGLDNDLIIPQYYGGYSGVTPSNQFYNMQPGPRDVALKIKLNPQYDDDITVSHLRHVLQQAIGSSRTGLVELRFIYNTTLFAAYVRGFVAKFEASIFSDNPEVILTIHCDFPFLLSPTETELAGSSLTAAMPNPTLSDTSSTAPHGFRMDLTIGSGGTASPFVIQGKYGYTIAPFTINQAMVSGDTLHFSSVYGDKYLYYIHSGVTTHLTDKIAAGSIWPIMFPGDTRITFGYSNITITSLRFQKYYWGI